MTFQLSARQLAEHAKAYQNIVKRPLSTEEMLHIAKLHHEPIQIDPADIRIGNTKDNPRAEAGSVSLDRGDIRVNDPVAREGSVSLARSDVKMRPAPRMSVAVGEPRFEGPHVEVGTPRIEGDTEVADAGPSQSAPLDFSGDPPMLSSQDMVADSGTPEGLDFAGDTPQLGGQAMADSSPGAPIDFAGDAPALGGQPLDFAGGQGQLAASDMAQPMDFGGQPSVSPKPIDFRGQSRLAAKPIDFAGSQGRLPQRVAALDFKGEPGQLDSAAQPPATAGLDFQGEPPVADAGPWQMMTMESNMPEGDNIPGIGPARSPGYTPVSAQQHAYKDDAYADSLAQEADRRSQEAEQLGLEADAEHADSVMTAAQATSEANTANSEEYDKLNKAAGVAETRLKEIIAQGEETAAAQMQRVQLASANAATMEMRDFFADKSTVGKIMAIISQTLAGGANYLAGQPGAPTPLDKIIADDTAKQQSRLAQAKDTAEREKNLLEQAYKNTGSRVAAQGAVTDAAYAKVEAALKATAARMNTPMAVAAAQKSIGDIKAKRAELQQKTATALRSDAIKASGGAGKAMADLDKTNQKKAALAGKIAAADAMQLEDVETPSGVPVSYKERIAKKVIEPAKDALNAIGELQRINSDKNTPGLERYLKISQAQAVVDVIEKNRAVFGGALSANEEKMLKAMSGGEKLQTYAKFFASPAYDDALRSLSLRIKNWVNSSLSYRGVKVREGSVFYLKHAQRIDQEGVPAMLARPPAAAPRQRQQASAAPVLDFSDSDGDSDTEGEADADA